MIAAYRIGELPKYLKEMKIREAEKMRLESLIDPNCPPGHTLLCEVDRLESLNIAKKSKFDNLILYRKPEFYNIFISVYPEYQDLINELNRMPMTSRTLRVRNRQIAIERELNQLDDTIQIFSRPKVYVKNEE